MNSHPNSPSRRCPVVPLPASGLLLCLVLFVGGLASPVSAQTLMMKFGFEDAGATTTDSVSGVVLSLTNNAGASADLHGAGGTGVSGIGKALDFTSSPANNTAACVACTLNDPTIDFGTISSFTMTMWIKPTGTLNFARLFGLAATTVLDNGAANSLGIQPNNAAASVQASVNAVNTTVTGQNLANNQWTFLAYTYDGSTIRVYSASEGTPVGVGGSIANAGGSVTIGSPFNLWLGNRPGNRTRGLPAYYDDVRFYTGSADTNFLESVRQSALPDPNVTATVVSPANAPIGARVIISAGVSGTAPLTNQWIFTDTNGVTTSLPNATNTSYVIPSAQTSNAGSYRLVVSNNLGARTNTAGVLNVTSLAGAGVTILDVGSAPPVPQAGDIAQLQTANIVSGGNSQDGLNYYADGTPGQTFTTGPNAGGYVINGIYLKTGGVDSSATGTAKTYTLRLYAMSGTAATLISTYVTTNSVAFTDGNWLLYSGGFTNILQPNTVYAYTHHQNAAGWDLMGYNNDGSDQYAGGEMTVIPAAGGTALLGASHLDDAGFDVALSTTPAVPVIYQQPASQTITIGQATTFNVGALGASPTYQWYTTSDNNYSNSHLIGGATGSGYAIASPALSDATNYFVVVNGGSSSVTSSIASLTVRSSVNALAWLGNSSFNWDLATANWSNTVTTTPNVLYQTGDNVQFTDAGKSTSAINLTAALAPTSVSVFSSSNYIFAGPGNLAGNVQLTKAGTGTLTVSNANTFRGATVINNGTLQLGNAAALGAATNSVTVNGGTLDFRGIGAPASLQYNIQGSGYTNTGALANSGAAIQNGNGVLGVNLIGDATVGGAGRWDLYGTSGGSGLHGNNHNLTKVGAGTVFFIDAGPNNQLADVNILNGTLGFQGTNDLGDPNKTISVLGATLAFYGIPAGLVETKNIVLSNAFFSNAGGNVTLNAPISLLGTNTHPTGFQENNAIIATFNGPITGTGGWVKSNLGQDIFAGTNTYSGPTFINSGLMSISGNSSLGNSSLIQLGSTAAILDFSGASQGLKLGNGQTLTGLSTPGFPNIFGDVTGNSGSTISPGIGGPGALVMSGSLAESGATNAIELGSDPSQLGGVNDYIGVGGSLTLSGVNTIRISPIGPLSTVSPYTILSYGGVLTGGAANLHIASGNPRYTISLVDPATTPSLIQVSVSGIAAPLVWRGGDASFPNIWNHTVSNFVNTGTSARDQFYDGDLITFDDTGLTNIVNVTDITAPGLLTLNNNTLNYTFQGNGTLNGTLDKEGSGTATLAILPALNFITDNLGSLVFNVPVSNAVLNAVISDNGSGLGTIVQNGTNLLTLAGNNSAFNGTILVNNGVLGYTTTAGLGGAGNLYVTNGTGTLNLGNNIAITTGAKSIHIAGAGFNGQGAINGGASGGPVPLMTGTVTMDGDATIAANPRWDFATGSTLIGNDFALTKIGTADIWFIAANNTSMGDAHIVQGVLGFQQGTSMGDPAKTITVESNATCGLWANAATFLDKRIVLNNGGTIASGGDTNTLLGALTLVSNNTLSVTTDLHLEGPVGGAGGFSKLGAAVLYLDGTNTYTGNTTIGASSIVAVGVNSSLGASATIEIDGGSTLDVTAPAAFTLGAGQRVIGNGSILGGSVNFGSGSTLSVGFTGGTATLSIFGSLTFQPGSTNVVDVNRTTAVANDKVTGLSSVAMNGTLVINYLGNPLLPGDAIPLFSATTYTGGFANIIPAIPGPGLTWDTHTLTTDGTLRVAGVATPRIGTTTVSGGNVVFAGSGGPAGASYTVLSQTNLLQPLSAWTILGTSAFDTSGNFSFTNTVVPGTPTRFYLIRVP